MPVKESAPFNGKGFIIFKVDLLIIFNIIKTENEVSEHQSYFLFPFLLSIGLSKEISFLMSSTVMYIIYMVYVYIYRGLYPQLMSAKDFYIQNITVLEHDNHSDSFQDKIPNVFTNYMNGAMRVEDKKYIDWENYKFTLWQIHLNFVVSCVSSACGVSIKHMNAKKPMIRSIYRFHVYYHIREHKFHCYMRIISINIIIHITMKSL